MQLPLWQQRPDTMQALPEIRRIVDARLRRTLAFRRLRAALAYWLVRCIGPRLVLLALRARITPDLSAPHVGVVWQHREVFERMAQENPRLLPALTAWLQDSRRGLPPGTLDAVPALRASVLAQRLPPQAWRQLAAQGTRRLVPRKGAHLSWGQIVWYLTALNNAHWPVLPPRGWLGLLEDTVGIPEVYDAATLLVPGWFWNWVCTAAHACAHDAAALAQLRADVTRWAPLVRRYRPHPDANQQRRRLAWLRSWARRTEAAARHESECTWGDWLAPVSWRAYRRLQVVPLLSARDVYDEGQALHNCAADYVEDCRAGRYLMISLREPGTGRRVALLGLARAAAGEPWEWHQLAGPCNRSVPAWVHRFAQGVARRVRQMDDPCQASPLAPPSLAA